MGIMKTKEELEQERRDRRTKCLEEQALAIKPHVLSEQIHRLDSFRADLSEDIKQYEFECKRWGDFLSVFIKRGKEKPREYLWGQYTNKTCNAINLFVSRKIDLITGTPPDCLAHGNFIVFNEHDGKGGWREIVKARQPELVDFKPMLLMENTSQNTYIHWGSGNEYVQVELKELARPSEDDKIVFCGSGVTICVPFGKGQEVYDKILTAFADNTTHAEIAKPTKDRATDE